MFARVTTFQGSPERAASAFAGPAPLGTEPLEGERGAYVLLDRKSGKVVGITLWQTERDMLASAEVAKQVRERLAAASGATAPPTVETYEVVSQP
jgi:hypothetical protein